MSQDRRLKGIYDAGKVQSLINYFSQLNSDPQQLTDTCNDKQLQSNRTSGKCNTSINTVNRNSFESKPRLLSDDSIVTESGSENEYFHECRSHETVCTPMYTVSTAQINRTSKKKQKETTFQSSQIKKKPSKLRQPQMVNVLARFQDSCSSKQSNAKINN